MSCGNWLYLGWVGVRNGDDDFGDEGVDGDDKEDGEEDGGFHYSALSRQLQSLSRDGLRNPAAQPKEW